MNNISCKRKKYLQDNGVAQIFWKVISTTVSHSVLPFNSRWFYIADTAKWILCKCTNTMPGGRSFSNIFAKVIVNVISHSQWHEKQHFLNKKKMKDTVSVLYKLVALFQTNSENKLWDSAWLYMYYKCWNNFVLSIYLKYKIGLGKILSCFILWLC